MYKDMKYPRPPVDRAARIFNSLLSPRTALHSGAAAQHYASLVFDALRKPHIADKLARFPPSTVSCSIVTVAALSS